MHSSQVRVRVYSSVRGVAADFLCFVFFFHDDDHDKDDDGD